MFCIFHVVLHIAFNLFFSASEMVHEKDYVLKTLEEIRTATEQVHNFKIVLILFSNGTNIFFV